MRLNKTDLSNLFNYLKTFDVVVIPCSSTKKDTRVALPANELYIGGFFKKQQGLATLLGKPTYILSTRYGLISPESRILPYELAWSKKLVQDNPHMRKKGIPVATEAHRNKIALEMATFCKGKKVLSFCSLHYKEYIPEAVYFNEVVGQYASNSSHRGIQFINTVMHQLVEEYNGTL